jgi:hypothetical protein
MYSITRIKVLTVACKNVLVVASKKKERAIVISNLGIYPFTFRSLNKRVLELTSIHTFI